MITATALATSVPHQEPLPFPSAPPLLPVPVERGQTGELRDRCARFAQALAEVIAGARPVRQLGPWLSREVYDQLHRNLVRRRGVARPGRCPRVVSVHLVQCDADAAEIAARMVHLGRSHAIALRLERERDAHDRLIWRCVAVEWA